MARKRLARCAAAVPQFPLPASRIAKHNAAPRSLPLSLPVVIDFAAIWNLAPAGIRCFLPSSVTNTSKGYASASWRRRSRNAPADLLAIQVDRGAAVVAQGEAEFHRVRMCPAVNIEGQPIPAGPRRRRRRQTLALSSRRAAAGWRRPGSTLGMRKRGRTASSKAISGGLSSVKHPRIRADEL